MRKACLCLLFVMLCAAGTVAAAPAGVIGWLDGQKLMAESPKVQALQALLNQKGQEINKQLAEEKPNLTPEQFKQKQDEAYTTFIQLKKDMETQINNSIRQAAEQVAKEKKLSVILYKNSVEFGGLDVTAEVIKKMQ